MAIFKQDFPKWRLLLVLVISILVLQSPIEASIQADDATPLESYPGCLNWKELLHSNETRIRGVVNQAKSVVESKFESTQALVEAYNALLDLVLAGRLCSVYYIDLAYEVFELDRSDGRTLEDEDALQNLKQRFNPRVFRLFNHTAEFRFFAVNLPGYALYATEKPIYDFNYGTPEERVFRISALRPYDYRLTAFNWNLIRVDHPSKSEFQLMSTFGSKLVLLHLNERLRLVPTSASLASDADFFEVRLVQWYSPELVKMPNSDFLWGKDTGSGGFYTARKSVDSLLKMQLPRHLQNDAAGLGHEWDELEAGIVFRIEEMDSRFCVLKKTEGNSSSSDVIECIDAAPIWPLGHQMNSSCPTGDRITCSNGKEFCLDQQCDGFIDCSNGADENWYRCGAQVPNFCARADQFLCDFRCKPNKMKCDGVKDCEDGTDEVGCSTKAVDLSTEVLGLYPPCRDTSDLLDEYRLTDFFQVFNVETGSLRLRKAYSALLDRILESSDKCTQDYVQLAFHVMEGRKKAEKNEEELREWTELEERFNSKIWPLFDVNKTWALMSDDRRGYAYNVMAKPSGLELWHSNNLALAANLVTYDQGRAFADLPFVHYKIRGGKAFPQPRMKFLPTEDSLAQSAQDFKFYIASGMSVLQKRDLIPKEQVYPICFQLTSDALMLSCSAVFYLKDMTDMEGSRRVTNIDEAKSWYPPCRNESDLLQEWRLWNFFKAFNASSTFSFMVGEAYNVMLDAILSSQFVCTQDYVQLAFKVKEVQEKYIMFEGEDDQWEQLRKRFNPKVFELFDNTRRWRIMSVNHPGYAVLGNDRQYGEIEETGPRRTELDFVKYDGRFPGLKWRFFVEEQSLTFNIKSDSGLPFDIGGSHWSRQQSIKLQVVPTLASVDQNSQVLQFILVDPQLGFVYNLNEAQVPHRQAGFLSSKSGSYSLSYGGRFDTLFKLEEVSRTAPSTQLTISEQVRELYPGCNNETDVNRLDRLWDVFQVFGDDLDVSVLIEAIEEAVMTLQQYHCTADYVQLASRVYEMERKTPENDRALWFGLKSSFNPGVYKLFDETRTYRIMSVDRPGCALFADWTRERISSRSFEWSELELVCPGNTSSPLELGHQWSFKQLPRASSFWLRSGFGSKWRLSGKYSENCVVVPEVESLDREAAVFTFELQFLSGYTRQHLKVKKNDTDTGSYELEKLYSEHMDLADWDEWRIAKFYLEDEL